MATLGKFENKSVTSATGASQTLAEEAPARKELFIYNIAATPWYVRLDGGTAAAGNPAVVTLNAGDSLSITATNKITAIGTAAAKLTVLER